MSNLPTESKEHPGYYEIPGYTNYLINREGQVYSKKRNKILRGKNIILRTEDGNLYSVTRERLFGLVFSNTEEENLYPRAKTKIRKKLNPKKVKLDSEEDVWAIGRFRKFVTECLYTGHMEIYDSSEALISFLGLATNALLHDIRTKGYYLYKNTLLVYPMNYRPNFDLKDLYSRWLNNRLKPVVVINDHTGEVNIYRNRQLAADSEGVASTAMYYRLRQHVVGNSSNRYYYLTEIIEHITQSLNTTGETT